MERSTAWRISGTVLKRMPRSGSFILGIKWKSQGLKPLWLPLGPGVAQRVPGGLGSQISWHLALKGGEVVRLTRRPPLPPGMFLVLIFTRSWVYPRVMVRSEGNVSLKNPVTPPGIVTQSALNRHTVRPFTESDDTRGCNNKICPPEDEQGTVQNMLRIIM